MYSKDLIAKIKKLYASQQNISKKYGFVNTSCVIYGKNDYDRIKLKRRPVSKLKRSNKIRKNREICVLKKSDDQSDYLKVENCIEISCQKCSRWIFNSQQ